MSTQPTPPAPPSARNDPEYIAWLEQRVSRLEERVSGDHTKRLDEIETLLNSSSLYHPDFWTRAQAVFGHNLALSIWIYALVLIVLWIAGVLIRK